MARREHYKLNKNIVGLHLLHFWIITDQSLYKKINQIKFLYVLVFNVYYTQKMHFSNRGTICGTNTKLLKSFSSS